MDDLDIYRLDRSGWPGAWDVDSIFALIVILTLWGLRKRELVILAVTQIRVRVLGLLALFAVVAFACSSASPPATAPLVPEAAPARESGPAMEWDFCATDKKSDPRWWLTIDAGVSDPEYSPPSGSPSEPAGAAPAPSAMPHKGQDLCATGYCP